MSKQAIAQGREKVSDLERLRSQINEDVMVIRSYRNRVDTERSETRLFSNLSSLNKLLEKGSIPFTIPEMKGDTNDEKIDKMNDWLGLKGGTEPPNTMIALARKLVEIYGSVAQTKVQVAVLAQADAQEAKVAETPAPATVAAVVPRPVAAADPVKDLVGRLQTFINDPIDSKTKKAAEGHKKKLDSIAKQSADQQMKNQKANKKKIDAATGFIDGMEKTKHELTEFALVFPPLVKATIADLDTIIQDPPDKKSKATAMKLKKKLEDVAKQSVEAQMKNRVAYQKKIDAADNFMKRMYGKEYARAVAVYNASNDPIFKEVDALRQDIEKGKVADPGNKILGMLPHLFQLRMTEKLYVWGLLKDFATVRSDEKYEAAEKKYATEQKYYVEKLDRVIDIYGRLKKNLIDSPSPTTAEFKAQEAGFKAKGLTVSLAMRSKSGMSNGKDDMIKAIEAREKFAKDLKARAKSGGLSYPFVEALYSAVESEDRLVSAMLSTYRFAKDKGTFNKMDEAAQAFLGYYADAALLVADPNFDIYANMTKENRRMAVARSLDKPLSAIFDPNQMSDAEIAQAEKKIRPLLMRSLETRHNDVIQNLYNSLLDLVEPSKDPQFKQAAELISLCANADDNYKKYMERKKFEHVQDAEKKDLSVSELTTDRVGFSIAFAKNVVTAAQAGAQKDDPVLSRASNWIKVTERWSEQSKGKMTVETAARVGDFLYYMAKDVASIRAAEIWKENAKIRSDSADVAAAGYGIERARDVFMQCFSGSNARPESWVMPGYHYNVSGSIANAVIGTLAPVALDLTRGPATVLSISKYANPIGIVDVKVESDPKPEERNSAAAVMELKHLSLLAELKSRKGFGVPILDQELGKTDIGLQGPRKALNFDVGGSNYSKSYDDFPLLDLRPFKKWGSVNPMDGHTILRPAEFNGEVHEDTQAYDNGHLYVELLRLVMLHANADVPSTLATMKTPLGKIKDAQLKTDMETICKRIGLDPSKLGDKTFLEVMRGEMFKASSAYATATGAEQQGRMNNLMLAVLDARTAELRSLVRGSVKLEDGVESVKNLEHYHNARASGYANDAEKTLEILQKVRPGLAAGAKSDLLGSPLDPRIWITEAENGIASLAPENFKGIKKEITAVFDYPKLEREQSHPGNVRFANFRVVQQNVKVGELGKETLMTKEEYEKKRGVEVLLRYGWIAYEEFSGGVIMVANPRRKALGESTVPEPAFVGRVMRDIRLPDGTTGDAVVRVEPRSERTAADYSTAMDYETVMKDGKYDILFVLKKPETAGEISYKPVFLDKRARSLAMKAAGTTFSLPSGANVRAIALPLIEGEEKKEEKK